jgi:hypothetical protein
MMLWMGQHADHVPRAIQRRGGAAAPVSSDSLDTIRISLFCILVERLELRISYYEELRAALYIIDFTLKKNIKEELKKK